MMPDNQTSAQGAGQEILKTEILVENYQIIAEWIRFADAKAAVTLTVNGVLLGLLIPISKRRFSFGACILRRLLTTLPARFPLLFLM